ncbi:MULTISPECIES: phospho-N-acetylmuramoyl-pentapeptide-transferase [unclassified Prochlorococcus]|uniref:phospho-N-acetylmuramoyl-pentapeptide- transferase n=1 Tax=unclassified Prochlorococcus TaxID=2627481 RepID=UPI0005338FEC|nr:MULTISPECIES: phospho-N-acetylmuramoyl-pentapeptide-transferase [unclassified Prochlorococcus]KGG14504.1 Phospho-N-acetylmuramoyl-pentapeptide-transferase [Prochlorococcus sp. MIT 0602]KGG16071.1 Phospho-N-acetylmuramoyl-pentapeptide-transferase [Prochlorococcus sp. MIT 0603]
MKFKKYIIKIPKLNFIDNNIYGSYFLIGIIFLTSLSIDILIKESLLFIPLLSSVIISSGVTQWAIPKLKKNKLCQIIREEGPKKHWQKSGTPSIGGLIIIPIGLIISNLATLNSIYKKELLTLTILILSFMFIGFLDDLQSISLKRNKGLSPMEKIYLQSIASIIFLIFIHSQKFVNSSISMLGDYSINFGIIFWPLALLTILAESNSSNLADGLDGLASGCGAILLTGLAIELTMRGNIENYDLAIFCISMAGAWLGFLIHNKKPAKIFMGDTGSLAMGATFAGVALLSNSLWTLFVMGGVFLAESLSVIFQVSIFKVTKKINGKGYRILRMSPLHHHFEQIGIKEIVIVQSFWLFSICFIFIGIMLRSNI